MSTSRCMFAGPTAVGPDYDGQIGHRYFDTGRYKADLICQIHCHSYLIEHDRVGEFEGRLGNQQLGVGAVDVQAPNVETGALVCLPVLRPTPGWPRNRQ